MGYSQLVLEMRVIDYDFQGNWGHFGEEFWEIRLVRIINFNGFELGPTNMHASWGVFQLLMKMGVIDLDLQGHFAISPQNSKTSHSTSPLYTGGRLNKKDGLTRYGDSHVKDKTS